MCMSRDFPIEQGRYHEKKQRDVVTGDSFETKRNCFFQIK